MPTEAVLDIELRCVNGMTTVKGPPYGLFGSWNHDEVDMISHQHIGMYPAVMFFAGRLKFFQIKAVIRIAAENLGMIITANDDMLRLAGNDHSGEASHGLNPERNTAGDPIDSFQPID